VLGLVLQLLLWLVLCLVLDFRVMIKVRFRRIRVIVNVIPRSN
jgi:hypothetical protein